MKSTLNTQADVKSLINILLNQVLDKENYNLTVEGEIHFDECEPDEEGYLIGSFKFIPWGADAFQCMQSLFENTVETDYISIDVTVHNLQEPVEATAPPKKDVTEDNVRTVFNETFLMLDTARSAGAMYVGDNGAYMLDYMDITEAERNTIVAVWTEAFTRDSFIYNEYRGNCMMLHIS